MKQTYSDKGFHHALKVVDELCIGCTHCMIACPTQAIRVRDGKAIIFEERCVDCGNCCKACPVSAILIEQDDFDLFFSYPVRVALVPSVFIGQFPSRINSGKIFGAMKSIGFTHIVEIDSVVDLVQQAYDRETKGSRCLRPAISTFCPAIVRLIQVRFPSLVDHLIRVKPPSDVAAIYYREKMEGQGYNPAELGIFYITPCAAKIASIKSPVGEARSSVDGVINMEYMYNKLLHIIINKEVGTETQADSTGLSSKGILWSLTRGESEHQPGRCLAVDGMSNVTEFLERLEETEESHIDFLELRACDESCAGGVLISGNRFLTVERLNKRAGEVSGEKAGKPDSGAVNLDLFFLDKIQSRSMLSLDPDREVAMEKMKKRDELLKVLPGIDCAACGSPSCSALAEDIVQGRAETSHCVFLQELYIRDKRLSLEDADKINASIWGKDRNYRSQSK
ncbi:MAG: [Fe-Fe] hydrogenase large subunit C-terminal domain-containing protein [Bacteroidales bacterium]|nr:[Fe-Fe] hydrogenase large subunit C-terminal domain-containing protein [Bacteroidales bacterium]